MDLEALKATAQAMVAPGKGILAIDESHGTCTKRFAALGLECDAENRRAYRGLLVAAPGAEAAISGMILFDETLRQSNDEGVSFPKSLEDRGIIPGIKVDTGAKDLALHPGEKVTEGLDGLRERLAEYYELGARFAKWRAVITIGDELPSQACLMANAHALARYAALCQEAGLVPMVEPEILLEGPHSIEACYGTSAETWEILFKELAAQGVALEGLILKTSMVLPGSTCDDQADLLTIAEMTVNCLKANVPAEVAGVVFLSGGQTAEDSTIRLNEMNKIGGMPWPLSFSYGRGIQAPALQVWARDHQAIGEAQNVLVHRAKMNGLAAKGEYDISLEV